MVAKVRVALVVVGATSCALLVYRHSARRPSVSLAQPNGHAVAALSVLSLGSASSSAQIVGTVSADNWAWLLEHLVALEGDVTLDCRRSVFVDPSALRLLVEYERTLHSQGRRVTILGIPDDALASARSIPRAATTTAA